VRNCNDPTPRERISLALIPVGCAVMAFLRGQRRPGSRWTFVLVIALGAVTTMKERQFPHASWWEPGSAGQAVFIALYLLVAVGTLFVILGFRRLLANEASKSAFAEAAEVVATLVEKETSLARNQMGVNIWVVKGMKGFRRLVRTATIVVDKRHETPITWTKGKGIIGEAWGRNTTRIADLDRVRAAFPTRDSWCRFEREDRFRLSWDEFEETKRYRAVLAVPLRRHRWARHTVRGVLAIDSLVPGKGPELNRLPTLPEFSSIRRTCEAAFGRDD
jgi:hypothetical protein